ncbi:MAG: SH3 domain-containing protein [Paracoccaceae bacterium]
MTPIRAAALAAALSLPAAAPAQQATTTAAPPVQTVAADAGTGTVTGFPVPRYVSLKATRANVRRGPSRSHRIDWVLVRQGMPLRVTAEHGHWRRVVDRDGQGGWIFHTMLTGTRTAVVERPVTLRARARDGARAEAELEVGVVARVEECLPAWCRLRAGRHVGWTPKAGLWGVGPFEVFED